ncbi:MAG: aspartate 1-decarboxylase [Candidatus Omnitrophica bacterium]|nr:aspartate 1-decarboxylase [Candidatus Omnitrophota bacterium]
MYRQILKAKIHRATVTDSRIDYEGSVTVDEELLKAANIAPWEKVLIANLNNGSRIESYAMPGESGSGVICMNGGAAKYAQKGDIVIIMSFAVMTDEELERHQPKMVYVDKQNRILSLKS